MSQEYEFEALTREEAAAMLYRLADGVAVGSVALGEESVAIPDGLAVEIEREDEEGEREIEVELEWPLSAEDGVAVATDDVDSSSTEVAADEGGGADAAAVEDAPVEAPTEEALTSDEGAEAGSRDPDAPDPTSVVEPGEAAESSSDARFELFADSAGEWRWRLVHANGNVIADSGEGYSRKADAKNGLRSVQTNAAGADVVEE